MKILIRLVITAISVIILSYVLPGVSIDGFVSALILAIVLAFLRNIVQPILIFLTLPVTIVTLGLFLLVINGFIILMADYFIDGFAVRNFWWALLFSFLLSFLQSLLYSILNKDK